MKKYLLLLICSVLVSCLSDDINKAAYRYEFFENSDLSISELEQSYMKYGTILNGDKDVFKYTYIAEEEEQIADDEYAEFIYFEIDANLNNFIIEGEDLLIAKTILNKSCFCFFPDDDEKNVNPTGIITGEKISTDEWKVNIDVTFYGEDSRKFEAIFILNK